MGKADGIGIKATAIRGAGLPSARSAVIVTRKGEEGSRWRNLFRHIAATTRDLDRAEDYLQAAYVKLEEYRARVPVENPAAFLARAARNIAIDDRRRRRRWGEADGAAPAMADFVDDRPLQLEMLLIQRKLDRVRLGLAQLTPRTREIFLRHRIDGLKYREIAEELDISVSAVEKHVAKAMLFLSDWSEGW